jgi:hypothetical protein
MKAVAKLEVELTALADELSNATAEADRLQAERPSVLLNGSDDDLRIIDEALARAQRTRERIEARREDCASRLEAAREEVAVTERTEARAAAERAASAAIATLRKSLASISRTARDLATTIENAEAMIDHANRLIGDDAERVLNIDARIGEERRLPIEILSEEIAEKWAYASSGALIAEQDRVTERRDGSGIFYSESVMGRTPHIAIRRQFVTRTYLPAIDDGYQRSIAEILEGLADLTTLKIEDTRSPVTEVKPA